MWLVIIQLKIGIILTFFSLLFAVASLAERKILARIQNRRGPNRVGPCGLFQPIADGIKMLIKEDVVPRKADRALHFLAPIVMVAPMVLLFGILPYGGGLTLVDLEVGLLFFFAVSSVSELAVFMAGWSSANKYSVFGAMRAIAQMVSYEVPLVLVAITPVMVAGSLSLVHMVEDQAGYAIGVIPNWFVLTPWGIVGFLLLFVTSLAEANRTPFDLPEGESELVAGHLTEYSGFKYALFFMGEYFGIFAGSGLAVALFLGGGGAPLPLLQWIPPYLWFFVKLVVLVGIVIWVRASLPRMRIDQLMDLCWKGLVPLAFVNLIAAAIWHYSGGGWQGWILAGGLLVGAYLMLNRVVLRSRCSWERKYYLAKS